MKTKKKYTFCICLLLIIVVSVAVYINVSHTEKPLTRGTFVYHSEFMDIGDDS